MKRTLPLLFGIALSFGFGWVALKPLFSGVVLGASTEVRATAAKTFAMTARQWEFDPSTITVDEGDSVTLNITSEDVTHGFSLSQFGVSKTLSPGSTTTVTFIADESGTFSFSCNVSCGTGHGGMRGTLIVNEADTDDDSDANENTNEAEDDEDENEQEDEDEQEDEADDDEDDDITAPSVPTALAATVVSSGEVALSWTASTDAVGVAGYNVYRNGTKIGTSTSTSYSDKTVKASTRYTYAVAAFDAESNASAQSGVAAATTIAPPDITAPVISGVSVGSITETGASVTWSTDEPAKGRIEYGTVSKSYPMKTADEKAELTTHGLQLTGLAASTTYVLRVMNADESGNVGYSAEVSFATTQNSGAANSNLNSAATNTATTNTATTNTSSFTAETATGIAGEASEGTAIAVPAPKLERIATPTSSVTIENVPVPEVVTGTAAESGTSTSATAPSFQASVGEPLTFEGTTTPNTDVTITIQSDPIVRTTRSDSEGKWAYIFRETDLLEPGDHTVTVAVKDQTAQTAVASDPVAFRIVPAALAETSSPTVTEDPSDSSWEIWGLAALLVALLVILPPLIIKYRKG